MPGKARTMGAGLGGSTSRNVNVNANTGGGNKKQGLSTTTNKKVQFVSNAIKNRSYGESRNVIFCMNQLGGVGAVSGGSNSRMFGSTSDGVKDCITGPYGCEQLVREAYLEAFGREPDASGLRTYCLAMTRRGFSKADVIADLIKNGDSLACINHSSNSNSNSSNSSTCGHVIDGSIRGARVTQIQNGEIVFIGTTNAQGNFNLTNADLSEDAAPFVATGGTDIATGLPNNLTLKSNGAIISPATTVSVAIQEADSSLTVDEANKKAADYLGITTEQLTSDYINNLDNNSADVVASALAVQRASVQVATIIETASILSVESNNEADLFNGLGDLIANSTSNSERVTDTNATKDIVNSTAAATIDATTLSNISTIIAEVFNDSSVTSSSQVNQVQIQVISQAEDDDFVEELSDSTLDTDTLATTIVTDSDAVELPGSEIRPVIVMNGNNPATVELGSTYTDAGATATDSSEETITVITSGTVNIDVIGTYSIMYSATDGNGLQAVQLIRTVDVVDTTPPVITVTGDNPATVELGSTYTDAGVTVTDLSVPVTITTDGLLNVDVNAVGSYTVTYTATDSEGVKSQATRTVDVVDTTAPVITVLGDNPAIVELGSTYTDAGATADGNEPVTTTGTVDTTTVSQYTIAYSATDAANNVGTATRTVNVVDTTPPSLVSVIALSGAGSYKAGDQINIKVEWNENITVVNPVINGYAKLTLSNGAQANSVGIGDDNITFRYNVQSNDQESSDLKVTGYTGIIQDANGNDAEQIDSTTFNIANVIIDTTSPIINPVSIVSNNNNDTSFANVGDTITLSFEVDEALDDDPTVQILDKTATKDTSSAGLNYVYTYTVVSGDTEGTVGFSISVTDVAGNVKAATTTTDSTIVTIDTTAPNISNLLSTNYIKKPGDTVAINVNDIESGWKVWLAPYGWANDYPDRFENAKTAGVNVSEWDGSSSSIEVPDIDTIFDDLELHIYVVDQAENISPQITYSINVDRVEPLISLTGDPIVNVALGSTYNDDGATATDNVDGDLTNSITIVDPVDVTQIDTYTVTYNVTDTAGNAATEVTRTVNVIDGTAPVITRLGAASVNIVEGYTYNDAGATAEDAVDGIITNNIVATIVDKDDNDVTQTINWHANAENAKSPYEIRYNVSDSAGNAATQVTRTVNVLQQGVKIQSYQDRPSSCPSWSYNNGDGKLYRSITFATKNAPAASDWADKLGGGLINDGNGDYRMKMVRPDYTVRFYFNFQPSVNNSFSNNSEKPYYYDSNTNNNDKKYLIQDDNNAWPSVVEVQNTTSAYKWYIDMTFESINTIYGDFKLYIPSGYISYGPQGAYDVMPDQSTSEVPVLWLANMDPRCADE